MKLSENERQYLAAVCFTDEPEGRAPWLPDQFSLASKLLARADLHWFLGQVEAAGLTDELRADWPTDFWLTRNGHGAGFWDGDYPEGIGEQLADIAHALGELNVDKWRGRISFTPEPALYRVGGRGRFMLADAQAKAREIHERTGVFVALESVNV